MKNAIKTLIENPQEGVHLFIHKPSRLEFAVIGNNPGPYLKDCIPFSEREDWDFARVNHLNVLKDFKLITRYQFSEFAFIPVCCGRIQALWSFINEHTSLEVPELVVSLGHFCELYHITPDPNIKMRAPHG